MATVADGCIGDGGEVPVDVTVAGPWGIFTFLGSIVRLVTMVDVDGYIADDSCLRVELWVDVCSDRIVGAPCCSDAYDDGCAIPLDCTDGTSSYFAAGATAPSVASPMAP